jgi:acyl-CoA dehydrogenase
VAKNQKHRLGRLNWERYKILTKTDDMLQDILIERKVYASEEHKMMKGMIQEFISNEIMDHIDEWRKNGMVSRNLETSR